MSVAAAETNVSRETSCESDLDRLAIVGTHEAKAIVLGGMQLGVTYGEPDLYRNLFLAPQGDKPAFIGTQSTPTQYCDRSLIPAGCVQRREGGGKTLTRFGEVKGKAYAGHLLELSLSAGDVGLRALNGMARTFGTKKSLPPSDRTSIYRELLSNDGLHPSDIDASLGIGHKTVVENLRWMNEHGIVNFEGIDSSDYADHIVYGLPEKFDLDANGFAVSDMIYSTIRQLISQGERQLTLNQFIDSLNEQYPDAGFDGRSRRATAIGRVNKLIEEGYIEKNVATTRYRSSLTFVAGARPIVEQLVAIADGILSADEEFLREGRKRMRKILDDVESVRYLIDKAFKASPEANGLPFQERERLIEIYLLEQGSATLRDMSAALASAGMTYFSTKGTLVQMRKEGGAISESVEGQRDHAWTLTVRKD